MTDGSPDEYSERETQERMNAAIRRALNTPPKPHSEVVGKGKRAGDRSTSRVKKSEKKAR